MTETPSARPNLGRGPGAHGASPPRSYREGEAGLGERDQVLAALRHNGHAPSTNSGGFYWFVGCPVHGDAKPVRISSGRTIELKCLAGDPCTRDEVVENLGLGEIYPTERSTLNRLKSALVDSLGLDNIQEPVPLVKGILQVDSLAWLQGRPGHGKSFTALDLAGCVGTGQTWQGFPIETVGSVLYLAAEGVSGVRARVRAWEGAMGRPMTGVRFLPMAVQAANDAEWAAFVTLAEEIRPVLVVLDTQARITVGMEENSARDMGLLVHRLDRLRTATGACILVVHHEGRSGEHMRGSTALEGAATTILRAKKDEQSITITCVKQKDSPEFEPFNLRLVSCGSSAIVTLTGPSTYDSISSILGSRWLSTWWATFESEPVSPNVLIKSDVVAESTFHKNSNALVRAGIVVKEGKGNQTRYRLLKDPRS